MATMGSGQLIHPRRVKRIFEVFTRNSLDAHGGFGRLYGLGNHEFQRQDWRRR